MKTKSFDCTELKSRAQENILRDIRGMTPEEQRGYFRKKAEEGSLGEWWKRVKSRGTSNNMASEAVSPPLGT